MDAHLLFAALSNPRSTSTTVLGYQLLVLTSCRDLKQKAAKETKVPLGRCMNEEKLER
jgi:rRNA-processing protein FCF1